MVTGFCISDKYSTEINGLGKFFDDLRVAPFNSDPTVEDTDGDGLLDGEDPYKLEFNNYHIYNRSSAIQYALRWCNEYNSLYYCYDNDCTNFVSQCLHAGGIPEDEEWYSTRGEINHLITGWFLSVLPSKVEINGEEYMLGYKGQNLFYKWDVSDAWNSVNSNRSHFNNINYSCGTVKINREDNISEIISSESIQIGDIVYFDHEDDGIYEHAAIVSKIDEGKICYAAHTKSRKYQDIENYLNNLENDHTNPTINIVKVNNKVITG